MTRSTFALALAAALALIAGAEAHDGEVHRDPADDAAAHGAAAAIRTERPQFDADGSLRVPKALQRRLGLRTQPWSSHTPRAPLRLIAEVQAQPNTALTVVAPETGTLEAPAGGWPLPGSEVRAGTVLAWLRPALSQREIAQRRAQIAELDQKLVVGNVNVERLEYQNAVNVEAGGVAQGNIYFDREKADRNLLQTQRDLLQKSLTERVPLRAATAGRLIATSARNGALTSAGTVLFRLVDADGLRLVAHHDHPGLGSRVAAASLVRDAGTALRLAGEEPSADGSGWQIRFDVTAGADALQPGQRVEIAVTPQRLPQQLTLPAGACVHGADATAGVVWIHRDAEHFEPRRVASCDESALTRDALALADGDRIVTEGAALLALYR